MSSFKLLPLDNDASENALMRELDPCLVVIKPCHNFWRMDVYTWRRDDVDEVMEIARRHHFEVTPL